MRDRQERPLTREVLRGRVVGISVQFVDDGRLIAVEQLRKQSAVVDRQSVLLLPRVDRVLPLTEPRDAVVRLPQLAARS